MESRSCVFKIEPSVDVIDSSASESADKERLGGGPFRDRSGHIDAKSDAGRG